MSGKGANEWSGKLVGALTTLQAISFIQTVRQCFPEAIFSSRRNAAS